MPATASKSTASRKARVLFLIGVIASVRLTFSTFLVKIVSTIDIETT